MPGTGYQVPEDTNRHISENVHISDISETFLRPEDTNRHISENVHISDISETFLRHFATLTRADARTAARISYY